LINWNDPKSKVSKHFTVKDVTKGDPKRIPKGLTNRRNVKKLAKRLDSVVDEHGKLVINSWNRDPASNAKAGGAPNLQHLYGNAADVRLARADATKQRAFERWADGNWKGGVGRGMAKLGFVHLDLGPNRRWDY
jgi:uncharacterized protein YcbK (DUF882 family)